MPNIRSNLDSIHIFFITGHLLYEDIGYILFLSCMRPKYGLISPNMRSLTLVIGEYHYGYRYTWVTSWNYQTIITWILEVFLWSNFITAQYHNTYIKNRIFVTYNICNVNSNEQREQNIETCREVRQQIDENTII